MSHEIRTWVGTWNVGYQNPFQNTGAENGMEFLKVFMPLRFDIYVLGLQEGVFEEVWVEKVKCHLGIDYVAVDFEKVSGYGDGAFLREKFTCLWIWVRQDLIRSGIVQTQVSVSIRLGFVNSKGAACVVMRIANAVVCFIACHLSAEDKSERLESLNQLQRDLPREMGYLGCTLMAFHAVIWVGDFNFRCKSVTLPIARDLLEGRLNIHKYERSFDECKKLLRQGLGLSGFREPKKTRDFFPTYKRQRARQGNREEDYILQHTDPWYKGGGTSFKAPSFCDRILYRTAPLYDEFLDVSNYRAMMPRSPQDGLGVSDHDAVTCEFTMRPVVSLALPSYIRTIPPKKLCLTVYNVELYRIYIPKAPVLLQYGRLTARFPLPCESPMSAKESTEKGAVQILFRGDHPIDLCHLLLKVSGEYNGMAMFPVREVCRSPGPHFFSQTLECVGDVVRLRDHNGFARVGISCMMTFENSDKRL